jgi:DNA end-binding protein Ku
MPRLGRAYWKGFLRLSLVSIGVEIYNAVSADSEIRFHQIHKPSGKRVNYTKTVKGIGPIDAADIVKGYEIDDGSYVTLEPDEIDAIKLESKKTVDLKEFVDIAEIDPRYFERPFYIVPSDEVSGEGYQVIREALRKVGKAGVGQITMSGREHLVAVSPVDKGLVMEVLRYAHEIRPASAYFSDLWAAKLDAEMVKLAVELVGRKAAKFQPERYADSFAVALTQLVERKAKGRTISVKSEEPAQSSNVIDLMGALRRSLKSDSEAPPPKKRATGKR